MQIVTFNTSQASIPPDADGMAIRIAYILGSQVAVAGSISRMFLFVQASKSLPLPAKIDMMLNYFNEDGKATAVFENMKIMHKHFEKTKHKSSDLVKKYKAMEYSMLKIFNKQIDTMDLVLEAAGLSPLIELFDNEKVKSFFSEPSDEHDLMKGSHKPSDILSLNFDDIQLPKIFLIGNEFFEAPFSNCYNGFTLDSQAVDAPLIENKTLFFEEILQIPNLHYLTVNELKVLKNSLADKAPAWQQSILDWINMFKNESPISERAAFVENKILPLSAELNRNLCHNSYTKLLCSAEKLETPISIYVGEIPFNALLNYYVQHNVIGSCTISLMKNLEQTDPRFQRNWPVIFYRFSNDNKTSSDEEPQIQPTKKSINID